MIVRQFIIDMERVTYTLQKKSNIMISKFRVDLCTNVCLRALEIRICILTTLITRTDIVDNRSVLMEMLMLISLTVRTPQSIWIVKDQIYIVL